jgi:hypothetical protein
LPQDAKKEGSTAFLFAFFALFAVKKSSLSLALVSGRRHLGKKPAGRRVFCRRENKGLAPEVPIRCPSLSSLKKVNAATLYNTIDYF